MEYKTSVADGEVIGFLKQDSATQTSESELMQLKDILRSFEQLRAFAERINEGV